MKLLVVSDIHANLEAFETCLATAGSCDAVANLGDIVGYGASPNECTQRAREIAQDARVSLFVRGNHDRACSGVGDPVDFNFIALQAAQWTRRALDAPSLQFIRELPRGPVTHAALSGMQFVHGSPLDEDEYLFSMGQAFESLLEAEAEPPRRITFFGHTHVQGWFSKRGEHGSHLRPGYGIALGSGKDYRSEVQTASVRLDPASTYLVNPGSIGQPRDEDWRAAFCAYDTESETVTFYRVPYDVKSAQRRILDAGLPERLALRLAEGR